MAYDRKYTYSQAKNNNNTKIASFNKSHDLLIK